MAIPCRRSVHIAYFFLLQVAEARFPSYEEMALTLKDILTKHRIWAPQSPILRLRTTVYFFTVKKPFYPTHPGSQSYDRGIGPVLRGGGYLVICLAFTLYML